MSEKYLPDVAQTSRDVPWGLSTSANPAVTTRGFVILTFRAKTTMYNFKKLHKIILIGGPGAFKRQGGPHTAAMRANAPGKIRSRSLGPNTQLLAHGSQEVSMIHVTN